MGEEQEKVLMTLVEKTVEKASKHFEAGLNVDDQLKSIISAYEGVLHG